ncbi:HNH endonuclease [Candidatus Manganitrophus noduliformans]|nr:HNH endonuclease signature motif containing protein [Candidatus Manganitrophus noduliformans]
MPILDQIRPKDKNRIYDMVRDVGVDVSDWEASKGNALSAAANPKYCYNWSFVQPNEVVVLNLWHSDIEELDGVLTDELNARDIAKRGKGVTVRRATEMDEAIKEAYRKNLPIRVVLCEGTKRNRNDPNSKASKVHFRSLDPEPWHVAKYDMDTGQTTLMRGLGRGSDGFVDQFDMAVPLGRPAERGETKSFPFVRRPDVRRYVLLRANGRCEYCGAVGFTMANGQVYLETHHVVPLNEKGSDSVGNVVALCPNHHREAHHGKSRAEIRKTLQEKLENNS